MSVSRFHVWVRVLSVGLCLLGGIGLRPATAQVGLTSGPVTVQLPSARPSPYPVNNVILVHYYAATRTAGSVGPAVILIHDLGETPGGLSRHSLQRVAAHLAAHGIACAFMELPFHLSRFVPGERIIRRFAGSDIDADVAAFQQSVSDAQTVVSWLGRQPGVDPSHIGVVGFSIGAVIAHSLMGQDARLTAGVAFLGGGDLPDLYRHSLPVKLFGRFSAKLLTPETRAKLEAVDPITFASQNRPRRVLMVAAARDQYVPPANATALWNSLGRPHIIWTDTNHFAPFFFPDPDARLAEAYLAGVWAGQPDDAIRLPVLRLPTFKAGLLSGLGTRLTPDVQWQALSLGHRHDHLPVLQGALGLSGRGPFLGVGATVNAFLDIGYAARLRDGHWRPYVSVHGTL